MTLLCGARTGGATLCSVTPQTGEPHYRPAWQCGTRAYKCGAGLWGVTLGSVAPVTGVSHYPDFTNPWARDGFTRDAEAVKSQSVAPWTTELHLRVWHTRLGCDSVWHPGQWSHTSECGTLVWGVTLKNFRGTNLHQSEFHDHHSNSIIYITNSKHRFRGTNIHLNSTSHQQIHECKTKIETPSS